VVRLHPKKPEEVERRPKPTQPGMVGYKYEFQNEESD
jgi:hypothetical protein